MLKEMRLPPVQDFHTFPRHFTYKYAAKMNTFIFIIKWSLGTKANNKKDKKGVFYISLSK